MPRTGTTSLCEMALMCGLKPLHVLKNPNQYSDYKLLDAIKDGYNFFADTPFYNPEFLFGFLESQIKLEIKMIYSCKNFESWKESISKLYKSWNPLNVKTNNTKIHLMDILSYNYITTNYTTNQHYNYIKQIANLYNIKMLDYKFTDGWKPFCEFIDKEIPLLDLPNIDVLKK